MHLAKHAMPLGNTTAIHVHFMRVDFNMIKALMLYNVLLNAQMVCIQISQLECVKVSHKVPFN